MLEHNRAGDVLADRYRLTDLLTENEGGKFWRAFDTVLHRDVAVHIIEVSDRRAPLLRDAARRSATVADRRMLRVLDIDEVDDRCFVVNEWGSGTSLDILLAQGTPLPPTVAAWIVAEVGDTLALTHESGVAHGRLVPENVLIDHDGAVRLIGVAVDAALHGLTPGRSNTDIVDLVGLLYAALTGKWAGVSRSAVPPAPAQHGQVLRPRQVRAGIPRALDSLCDHVLNHGGDADVNPAMVSDSLREFLGDSAASAEAWLARLDHPRSVDGAIVLPPLPDPPAPVHPPGEVTAALTANATEDELEADSAAESTADDGIATQAGLPIFHDDTDDVTWLAKRTEAAPPPPPLEPPPERPLFAPEPTDGQPARRPRVVAPPGDRVAGGFWPWDTGSGSSASGSLMVVTEDDEEAERHPPGSNFLRLAGVIAACLVVLLVCVIVFNLGRGRTPLGATKDHATSPTSPTTSAPATPQPLHIVGAHDFDPQGNPPSENPDEVHFALDGDPTTSWSTMTYTQQFGPGGLKTGVGLVLDLGADHTVSEVDVSTVGSPTTVQAFVTPHAPTSLAGLKPAGQTVIPGAHGTVHLQPSASGRYVVVWLTRLPAVPGGFRGGISGVAVKGD